MGVQRVIIWRLCFVRRQFNRRLRVLGQKRGKIGLIKWMVACHVIESVLYLPHEKEGVT